MQPLPTTITSRIQLGPNLLNRLVADAGPLKDDLGVARTNANASACNQLEGVPMLDTCLGPLARAKAYAFANASACNQLEGVATRSGARGAACTIHNASSHDGDGCIVGNVGSIDI
eukprot:1178955-Amphidinium_carterae.1